MGGSDVPDRARSRGAPISSSTPPASPRGASRGRCPPGPQVSYQLKMSEELFWRRRPSWGHRIAEGLAVLTKSALARLRHKSSLTPPHRVIEYLRTTTHRRSFQSIPLGPLGRRHVVARSARRGEGASKFYNRHARGKARPPPEDGTDARAFNAATTTARSSTLSSSDGLRKSGGHLARCAPLVAYVSHGCNTACVRSFTRACWSPPPPWAGSTARLLSGAAFFCVRGSERGV
jgi:hypothetical protein